MLNAGRGSEARARAAAGSRAGTPPPPSASCPRAAPRAGARRPAPQAMVRASSRTVPGGALAAVGNERGAQHLDALRLRPRGAASNQAPGAGDSPRTWLCTSRAGLREVDAGLVLVDLGGVGDALGRLRRAVAASPCSSSASARTISAAPRSARTSCSSPAVMSGPIGTRSVRGRRAPCRGPRPCA